MKTLHAMKEQLDDISGIILGIMGGSLYVWIADINWQSAWETFGKIIWLGFVAIFSGAMGVIGKKLMAKFYNRKKKTDVGKDQ